MVEGSLVLYDPELSRQKNLTDPRRGCIAIAIHELDEFRESAILRQCGGGHGTTGNAHQGRADYRVFPAPWDRKPGSDVEDDWTDIPFNQETSDFDGRLYPPLWENLRSLSDHPDVKRHRHRWHNTFFAMNGAIEVVEVHSGAIVFLKPGSDG